MIAGRVNNDPQGSRLSDGMSAALVRGVEITRGRRGRIANPLIRSAAQEGARAGPKSAEPLGRNSSMESAGRSERGRLTRRRSRVAGGRRMRVVRVGSFLRRGLARAARASRGRIAVSGLALNDRIAAKSRSDRGALRAVKASRAVNDLQGSLAGTENLARGNLRDLARGNRERGNLDRRNLALGRSSVSARLRRADLIARGRAGSGRSFGSAGRRVSLGSRAAVDGSRSRAGRSSEGPASAALRRGDLTAGDQAQREGRHSGAEINRGSRRRNSVSGDRASRDSRRADSGNRGGRLEDRVSPLGSRSENHRDRLGSRNRAGSSRGSVRKMRVVRANERAGLHYCN